MGQYVLLSPSGNKKLKALLKGAVLQRMFLFSFCDDLVFLVRSFFDEQAVYLRFSHLSNFQPKFYIGSTSSTVFGPRRHPFSQVHAGATEQICPSGSCPAMLEQIRQFLDVVHFPVVHGQSQLWALEQALILIVAASTQHSVYLSIFQLP